MTVFIITFHLIEAADENSSKFSATKYTDSSTKVLTTYQLAVASTEQTPFNYYVDGLYGNECLARILNYVVANNMVLFMDVASCACVGVCDPPLAPNPGALAWLQATKQAMNNVNSVLTYFKTYSFFIVITGLIVIMGLVGQCTCGIN